jgi:hypothetical protein
LFAAAQLDLLVSKLVAGAAQTLTGWPNWTSPTTKGQKIVKTFVKNAVAGLCVAALFLLVMSTPARAQVLAHSGDIAGNVGYLHVNWDSTFLSSDNHAVYRIDGGYNVTPHVTVLGEWAYGPLGSVSGSGDGTVKTQIFGGGARFNLTPDKKLVPYGVVTFGGDRNTWSISGVGSATYSGYYYGVGGGASYYVGKNWGVRPEFRYVRAEFGVGGVNESANAFAMTGGVFYQWGGKGKNK